MTVEAAVDVHGLCEFARAVEKAGEAEDGGEAPDEDATGGAVGFGDDVEAFVDAVVEIDVGVAGGAEDDAGAGGDAAAGVGGLIQGTEIGFYFDNTALAVAVDEQFAEEGAGDSDGIAGVEALGKGNQR